MNDERGKQDEYRAEVFALLRQAEKAEKERANGRALGLYHELLAFILEASGGEEEIILVLLRLGDLHARMGHEDKALLCYEDGEERSRRIDFIHGALDCIHRRGILHMMAGRWNTAAKVAEEGRALSKDTGDESFETVFLGLLGQVLRRVGDTEKALEYALEGLELAQRQGNLDEELTFLSDMALVSLGKRDFEGALKQADAGARRARETGRAERVSVFLGQKCQALRGLGDIEGARSCAAQGIEMARDNNDMKEVGTFYHDLALLARTSGQLEQATKACMDAYGTFLGLGSKEGALTSLLLMSQLCAERGDWEAAFKSLLDAMVLSVSMERRLFSGTFFRVGHVISELWGQKAYDEIEQGLKLMEEFFHHIGQGVHVPATDPTFMTYIHKVLECLADVARTRGDAKSEWLEKARKTAADVDVALGSELEIFIEGLFKDPSRPAQP